MKSQWEEMLALHLRSAGLGYEREYRFDPDRRWRADFCVGDMLIEVEGGTWTNGRHNRGKGFAADCEKYNRATELGYRVLRYTAEMIKSGEAVSQIVKMDVR